MLNRLAPVCIALGLLGGGSALAADSGWYVGGSVGKVSSDVGLNEANGVRDIVYFIRSIGAVGGTAEVDDSTEAWSVLAGYRFSPHLAVEAAYVDLGEVVYHYRGEVGGGGLPLPFPFFPPTPTFDPAESDIEWKNTAVTAKLIGRLPLGDKFDVHAHVGLATTRTDVTSLTRVGGSRSTSFTVTDDTDSINLTYGVGAAYRLHGRWSLSLDWQRYEVSEDDTSPLDIEANYDVISLSLLFRLGASN
jgi:opacity protein-like surface antigen